jgi:hypothetical protein
MARGKQKSLKDVAKVFQKKALQAINPGVPYKPYKSGFSKAYRTGKLQSSIASTNTVDRMIGESKDKFTFTFNISPQSAPYGKYVHNGTYKMGKRPFAEIAAESPEFKKVLDEYINDTIVKGKLDSFFDIIDKQMVNAGIKVSTS